MPRLVGGTHGLWTDIVLLALERCFLLQTLPNAALWLCICGISTCDAYTLPRCSAALRGRERAWAGLLKAGAPARGCLAEKGESRTGRWGARYKGPTKPCVLALLVLLAG